VATILDSGSTGLDAKGRKIATQAGGTFRISLAMTGMPATAAAAAKRIMKDINATFIPSGQVARQLKVGPRSLGMLTGNLWLKVGPDRGDRIDIGLAVKDGRNSLCVPEFCKPAPSGFGWVYTCALRPSLFCQPFHHPPFLVFFGQLFGAITCCSSQWG
jgi:hypothetical protein